MLILSRQRELSDSTTDDIRNRIASTIQSASLPDSNLTKDERTVLKRLLTDKDIIVLPADKGRVAVVMDKTIMTKRTYLLTTNRPMKYLN